ncbi:MAG: hypothetical protein H7240_07185 [Glaciimonas sp.]|nr:hypothetical protein [Glaciimonas sp.]
MNMDTKADKVEDESNKDADAAADVAGVAYVEPAIRAILIHGMGRTPLSMLILAARLWAGGLRPVMFSYSAAFER